MKVVYDPLHEVHHSQQTERWTHFSWSHDVTLNFTQNFRSLHWQH